MAATLRLRCGRRQGHRDDRAGGRDGPRPPGGRRRAARPPPARSCASTASAARSGTRQPPAWSVSAGAAPSRDARPRVPQHAARPDDQPHPAQVLARVRTSPDSCGRACRRSATVTASSASRASTARPCVVVGQPRRVGRRALGLGRQRGGLGGVEQPLGDRGGDDAGSVPAHAEVALDRAAAPQRLDDLTVQRGLLRVWRQDRVDVGRRAAARRPRPRHRRPATPRRRRRAARRRRAPRPASPPAPSPRTRGDPDRCLPPITCRMNTSRIAARGPAAGRARRSRGSTLAVAARPSRRAASSTAVTCVARVRVAGDDDRDTQGRARERGRVVQQHLGVAAVRAADQQHHVGRVGRRARRRRRRRAVRSRRAPPWRPRTGRPGSPPPR